MATHKPVTQVLLHIDKALQDEIVTESGLKLFFDGSYQKNWSATVTATIVALPINPHPKYKKIFSQLNIGDEVAVSYQVVSDLSFQGDAKQFIQSTEENPHLKEFVNGMGEWIRMYALPKRSGLSGPTWVATYTNKYRQFIDGVQGDEEEVYRWMAQFPFGKTDIYTFKNFFEYEGEKYWKADIDDVFAKKVKGHLVAVGDRIICKPIEELVPEPYLIKEHRGHEVKMRYQDRARVVSGGKEKGIKKDDIVSFNPNHLEKYTFYGKEYHLINQNLVLGKWQPVTSKILTIS